MPLLSLLPLELLAYHAAVRRGGDHAASSLQSA
jgi:glucosamine 6-phosphate synthetase-like amidotransferase/phosphosugar isomerase protein